jgi:hypothetical protein
MATPEKQLTKRINRRLRRLGRSQARAIVRGVSQYEHDFSRILCGNDRLLFGLAKN